MIRMLVFVAVAALLASVPLASPALAKTKKNTMSSASRKKEGRSAENGGWKKVPTKRAELCDVSYQVEGGGITLKVKNLSPDKQARVTYAVQCQVQNKSGKWEQYATYPAEGISMTIKKQDEVEKNIRTGGSAIKDLAVKVEVAEAN